MDVPAAAGGEHFAKVTPFVKCTRGTAGCRDPESENQAHGCARRRRWRASRKSHAFCETHSGHGRKPWSRVRETAARRRRWRASRKSHTFC